MEYFRDMLRRWVDFDRIEADQLIAVDPPSAEASR
jgi:hypothetical protein